MLRLEQFEKRFSVLRKNQILSPKFHALASLELPANAILHYLPTDPTDIGPDVNEITLINYPEPIFVNHLTEMVNKIGNPQRVTANPRALIDQYRKTHRRFLYLRNFATTNQQPRNLLVWNYGIAQQFYRYRPSVFVSYQRWFNQYYTMWEQVAHLQQDSTRSQFIPLSLPAILPSLTQLRNSSKKMGSGMEDEQAHPMDTLDAQWTAEDEAELQAEMAQSTPFQQMFVNLTRSLLKIKKYGSNSRRRKAEFVYDPRSQYNAAQYYHNSPLGDQTTYPEMDDDDDDYDETEGDGGDFDGGMEGIYNWGVEDLGAMESRITLTTPRLDQTALRPFQAANSYWMLDFWQWLAGERETSVMSLMDHNQLHKVNLLIENMGSFAILNLGRLMDWLNEMPKVQRGGEEVVNPVAKENYAKQLLLFFNKQFMMKTEGGFQPDTADEQSDEASTPLRDKRKPEVISSPELPDDIFDEEDDGTEIDTRNVYGVDVPVNPFDDIDKQVHQPDEPQLVPEPSEPVASDVEDATIAQLSDDVDDALLELPQAAQHLDDADDLMFEGGGAPEDGVMIKAIEMAESGQISASEFRRMEKVSSSYRRIKNPFGEGTLEDLITYDPVVLNTVPKAIGQDSDTILDKSMLDSTVTHVNTQYIKHVMQKDVANMVMGVQQAGIAITNYEVDEVVDALSAYDSYTIQFQPVGGLTTTRRFRIPKVQEDNTYTVNSVKSVLSWQRMDKPIRKINPSRVALNSYYGKKVFIDRSTKKVNSYEDWLHRNIIAESQPTPGSDVPSQVQGLVLGRHFDPTIKTPHTFAMLSRRFRQFQVGDCAFLFNTHDLEESVGKERFRELLSRDFVVCGKRGDDLLVMDTAGMVYAYPPALPSFQMLDTIENMVGLNVKDAPVEIVEVKINGRYVPMVIILCYYYGLTRLLKLLETSVRYVPRGERLQLTSEEVAIGFADEFLVYSRNDRLSSLILGGLNTYKDELRAFNRSNLDNPNIFLSMTSRQNVTANWYKEMGLMLDLFVDPITKEELIKLNAPTKFDALLIHAAKMLLSDEHRKETSMQEQRIVGYERFSGAVYKEMVKAVRSYRSRAVNTKQGVDLNPEAVWLRILTDTAAMPMDEANPIQNLKLKERVTSGGDGGRTATTMVRRTREYLEDYIGTISEATVDNANVAYISFLTANPNFVDLRGNVAQLENYDQTSQFASSVSLLNYGCDRDDPKRTVFASIQHAQAMYADGYRPTPLRTGYETLIAQRTDELYSGKADQDGKVIEVTKNHIAVEYTDGTVKAVELGTRIGSASGTYFTHTLVTDLKVGDSVMKNDIIAWNTNYFERDQINPSQVVWKAGVLARVAFMEDEFTYEDSSIISKALAEKLGTKIIKRVPITVDFRQEVRNLISEGMEVQYDSILCTIEDPITANLGAYSDEDYSGLSNLSAFGKTAKTHGRISKIDVLYNGDIDNMSESLALVANASDRKRGRVAKQLRKGGATTGQVLEGLRVDGNTVDPNKAVIFVYIEVPVPAGIGGKGVFGNQMKSTFGYIMDNETVTESGLTVDSIFSFKSELNRVVLSAIIQAMTNPLLRTYTEGAKDIFRKAKNLG